MRDDVVVRPVRLAYQGFNTEECLVAMQCKNCGIARLEEDFPKNKYGEKICTTCQSTDIGPLVQSTRGVIF